MSGSTEDLFPWRQAQLYAIGGLFQVGFAPGSDLLLVHSAQGRGMFDCAAAERLDRDDEEPMDSFDKATGLAEGFGPLAGQSIRMAGLFGGALPKITADGYTLEDRPSPDSPHTIFLAAPGADAVRAGDEGECELRAYGFSETGRSFVIATSCELVIFNRG